MAEIEIVDVTLPADDGGEARLNLGDEATGVGFSAGASAWSAGDGFIGVPNAPSGGAAAQALMLTTGNTRLALAIRDTRYDEKAGALGVGDRAVVSDCDAALLLSRALNAISIRSTDAYVTADGAAQKVFASGSQGITLTVGATSISLTPTGITLTVGATVLTIDASGASLTSTPPATLKVNGVAVVVP